MRAIQRIAVAVALGLAAFGSPAVAGTTYELVGGEFSLIGIPATLSPGEDTPDALFGDDFRAVDPGAAYASSWVLFKYGPFGVGGAFEYAIVGENEVLDTSLGYWILQAVAPSITVELPSSVGELPPPGTARNDALFWDETSGSYFAAQPPRETVEASSMQPYLGVNYIISLRGQFPSRNAVDPLLGEITLFAGNFAPRDWALCDGQLLPIAQNTALFSLLGTLYGGDGRTTFALPDLRGRAALHSGNGPGLMPVPQGQRGGANTHRHAIQLPALPPQ